MKRWLVILATLIVSAPAATQETALRVRLYWTQRILEAKLTPQGTVQMKRCATCTAEVVRQPITFRVDGERISMDGQPASGDSVDVAGAYRLEVPGHPAVVVDYPLTITTANGWLLLTIRMPLEDYVAGVLAGESSGFRSTESLKAMAVAVRTYGVHFRGRHKHEGFDLCDTTHCQDLRLGAVNERLRGAAETTEGEMLWYEGRPAATYYHRHCGGTTEAASRAWETHNVPYLTRHADAYCSTHSRNEWRSALPLEQIGRALGAAGIRVPTPLHGVEITRRTESGRVAELRLAGSPAQMISAEDFRLAVGRALGWQHIRSDLYEVHVSGNQAAFHGFGAGHGVGLCQAGTAQMGELRKSYAEILDYYYPGTRLGLTAQGIAWRAMAGERVEVITTRPQQDGFVVALAERLLREAEQAAGLALTARTQVRVYPSVEVYRNATGSPGWVAATTRGRVIRLQPTGVLRQAGKLEETLRHEILHLLVESRVRRPLPLWFREGLVLVLSRDGATPVSDDPPRGAAEVERALRGARTEVELRGAYSEAERLVAMLIARHGRAAVMGWLETGLPAEIR